MRTAGLMMNDVWADRVLREHGVEAYSYEGLDAEVGVLVESVNLKHRSKEENYRPYLHLSGELRSVVPPAGIYYDISEVSYSPGQGERVDAYYEFDDEQLVDLARKGYFTNTFVVPEQITGIEWELPAKVDLLILAPTGTETDNGAPVVFTRVHETGDLEVDLESSGYDVTEYFADHSNHSNRSTERQEQTVIDERGLKARSDAINSLFAEDEFGIDAAGQRVPEGRAEQQEATELDGVAAELQRAEEAIAAEAEQLRAEREEQAGSPENLYRDRVAQAAALTPEASEGSESVEREDEERALFSGDLDLDLDEPEAGPSFAERQRWAVERAADLDRGDEESGKVFGD